MVFDQQGRAPIFRVFASEDCDQRGALHRILRLLSCQFENRRGQIDTEHHPLRPDARLDQARVADHHGDTHRLFVGQASLGIQAVLTVEVSMIAGHHEKGIVQFAGALQRLQQPTHTLVDTRDHLQPLANRRIGCRGVRPQRGQARDLPHQGGFVQWRNTGAREPHDRLVIVDAQVPVRRNEAALDQTKGRIRVHGLLREEKHERLFPRGLQERHGMVRKHVRYMPFESQELTAHVELRIPVRALADQADPGVESRPGRAVGAHVPLADECGVIAGPVELARERVQFVAATVGVVDDPVRVGVESRQEACPGRRAERRGRECIEKHRPPGRDPIDVGCADKGMPTGIEIVPPHVVHKHHHKIRPIAYLSKTRRRRGQSQQAANRQKRTEKPHIAGHGDISLHSRCHAFHAIRI